MLRKNIQKQTYAQKNNKNECGLQGALIYFSYVTNEPKMEVFCYKTTIFGHLLNTHTH